ncbi:MAG: tetratricopeptide repeat protein, partial [Lachnospiraceae bacterium]|nr:tetratricopeptide repeat protein [Lachnospiraceae bacterium]
PIYSSAASDVYKIQYYNMASAYQGLGKYEKSLDFYKKAEDTWRKTLPEHSVRFMEIHQGRGECLMMSEQYKEAIAEYMQALSLLNSQVWPRIEITTDIAECYYMLGELENAKAHYIQALKYINEWEETEAGMQVRILLNLCGLENHLGNSTESDAYYQMAVQDAQQSEDPELISIVSTYKIQ